MTWIASRAGNRSFLFADTRYRFHLWAAGGGARAAVYCGIKPALRECNVRPDTAVVIEGFPRTANTYAVAAFTRANPNVRIAHHLHTPASLHSGVKRGLPTLVLIRNPMDACVSLIQRQRVTAKTALKSYVAFYEAALELVHSCVIVDFSDAVADFGRVTRRLNERFGTSFVLYEKSPEGERWCRDFVIAADVSDQGSLNPQTAALPFRERSAGRDSIVASVNKQAQLLVRALTLYDDLRGHDPLLN